jgi:hypothetical protein
VSQSNTPEPRGGEQPFDVKQFARNTIFAIESGDAYASVLERRVIRLEEIIAARWPRSMFLRRRLAREVRASVAAWDEAYIPRGDFYARRLEAAGQEASGIIGRQDRARAAGWPEPGNADPGEGFVP